MGRYKYTSNKDPLDGTEEIRLEGRDPVRVGGEVELTDAEYDLLKGRLNLRKVESDAGAGDKAPGADSPEESSK
jgi:hypothetical protein